MELFEEEKAESINFIRLLYRKRKVIIISVGLTCLLAGILTWMTPPQFYSFGTIFSPNTNNSADLMENPQFGHDTQADQLIQLLESEQVRDSIILKYDLLGYYHIDTNGINWKQDLDRKFIADISIKRTKYMSLVISATMKDPLLAANAVNTMIDVADHLRQDIFAANRNEALAAYEFEFNRQQGIVDSIRNRIYTLKDTTQAMDLLYNHLESRKKDRIDPNNPFVDSPEMERLINDYRFQFNFLQQIKADYAQASVFLRKPFPGIYKVDRAIPSFKKASPSYSVNVGMAFLLSLTLTLVILILAERIRQVKNELKA